MLIGLRGQRRISMVSAQEDDESSELKEISLSPPFQIFSGNSDKPDPP